MALTIRLRLRRYSIFNLFKENIKLDFPWQLSTVENQKIPTVLESIKLSHRRQLGILRARKLLKDDAYDFPGQFNKDASKVFIEAIRAIPSDGLALKESVLPELHELYQRGLDDLKAKKESIEFEFHSEPVVRVNKLQFFYGPCPIPEDYVVQTWFELISIALPAEEAIFESHGRQTALLKRAEEQGCYFRIHTTIDVDLEFSLFNENGLPLLRDRRSFVDVVFTSPYFNPYDEIFELNEDGTWKLGFKWRIVDIDNSYSNSLNILP